MFPSRSWGPFLLGSALALSGCGFFSPTYESLLELERSGKTLEAIQGFQQYLQKHPGTPLAAPIHYRIAKDYADQADYSNAILWYGRILAQFPHTDEEFHALLDLSALYHDKLKDPSKIQEYNQRVYLRYLDNPEVREAIQSLIDNQLSGALSQYGIKNYKGTQDALGGIQKSFPMVFVPPDTQAKIDSLGDKARRALALSNASADWIVLKGEVPYNKSYEADFPPPVQDGQSLASPDGNYLVQRKKAANGRFYLYLAQVPPKGDQVRFELVPQTIGAEQPVWSPDSRELVYWRSQGNSRHLDKTDVKSKVTQVLFFTKGKNLGIHPAYHPAGNKIAYVYEGCITLANTGSEGFKQMLKTAKKLDYTALLAWSVDGTMIRCTQNDASGNPTDEVLILDVSAPTNP